MTRYPKLPFCLEIGSTPKYMENLNGSGLGTTRRSFIKKSALTVSGVALLSKGMALETEGPSSASKCKGKCDHNVVVYDLTVYMGALPSPSTGVVYFQKARCHCTAAAQHNMGEYRKELEPLLDFTAWGPTPIPPLHSPNCAAVCGQ
jgi:hypothetical protein